MNHSDADALTTYVNGHSERYHAEPLHVKNDWWVILTHRATGGVAPAIYDAPAYLQQYDGTRVLLRVRALLMSYIADRRSGQPQVGDLLNGGVPAPSAGT